MFDNLELILLTIDEVVRIVYFVKCVVDMLRTPLVLFEGHAPKRKRKISVCSLTFLLM